MARRDIFISYRREGGAHLAELISRELRGKGYSVFMDVHELRSGHFDDELRLQVAQCKDFIFLITRGSMERCLADQGDWVRAELALAIVNRINIIPVMDYGVQMPSKESLPPDIAELPRHNGLDYNHKQSKASFEDLIGRLRSNAKWYRRKELYWGGLLLLAASPILAILLGIFFLWRASVTYVPPKPPDMSGFTASLNEIRKIPKDISGIGNLYGSSVLELKDKNLDAVDFAKMSEYKNLRTLDFSGSKFDNKNLSGLPRNLEVSHFEGSSLDDMGLKSVAESRDLRKLYLDRSQITDKGMVLLSRIAPLTFLSLAGTSITDEGLKALGSCHATTLILDDTVVSGAGFASFPNKNNFRRGARKAFELISLKGTKLDDAGIKHLAGIEVAKLDIRSTSVTDAGIALLEKNESLAYLILDAGNVSPKAVQSLKMALPKIKIEY